MNPTAVLVLAEECAEITEALFGIGFTPLVCERMHGALDRLRHERFAAVVVDPTRMDVDVLEFVLNVRDIDAETPVIVVGESRDTQTDLVLQSQRQVILVGESDASARPAEVLERVLSSEDSRERPPS